MSFNSSLLTTIYNNFIDKVYNDDDPTSTDLLIVACHLALVWLIFIETGRATIWHFVKNKRWLKDAMHRDYEREGKKLLEMIGLSMTQAEYVEFRMKDWGWMQCVLMQHFVGGLLCVPSVFNLSTQSSIILNIDERTTASLACLSILSEMGWEIQDLIVMVYRRLFLPNGHKLVPNISLIIMPIHHSLTCMLGIPTILKYRSLKILHWMCFDLQAATAVSLFVAEYTKLLDVSKPNELRQFTLLTFFGFVVCIWARGIHWFYLIYEFIKIWIDDKAWTFLIVGSCVCLLFTLFSYFLCIEPFYKRLRKFTKLSYEYKSLPKDVSPKQRRASVIELQNAAMELSTATANEPLLAIEVATFFENYQSKAPPTGRRESMPTSILQRQRRLSGYIQQQQEQNSSGGGGSGGITKRALSTPMAFFSTSFRTKLNNELESTNEEEEEEEKNKESTEIDKHVREKAD